MTDAIMSRGRIRELDGLRGIAVSLVVLFHFFGGGDGHSIVSNNYIRWLINRGWSGVDLFFVLSGLLIGGIILDNPVGAHFMKVFYYRRLLRIFHLYYILLLIVIILSPFLPEVVLITSKPWVYVLYLQNFWLAWGEKIDEWLAPTWSLAVEEHFYILLPLLVIALNKRSLLWICGVAIGLAITLRSAMSIFGIQHGNGIAGFFTLCRMDDLFVGVLAALLLRDEHCVRIIENRKTKLYIFALIFGLMMPVITYLDLNKPTMPFTNTIGFSIYYCFYVSVIIIVVVHTRGFLASVMRSYVLCWLGVRAYSIYIFHMMALSAGVFIARKAGYSTSYQSRIIAIALVLAVAAIMWRYIEGPLIKMGHRLAYAPVTPGPLDSQTERNVHISARAGVDMDGCGVA